MEDQFSAEFHVATPAAFPKLVLTLVLLPSWALALSFQANLIKKVAPKSSCSIGWSHVGSFTTSDFVLVVSSWFQFCLNW